MPVRLVVSGRLLMSGVSQISRSCRRLRGRWRCWGMAEEEESKEGRFSIRFGAKVLAVVTHCVGVGLLSAAWPVDRHCHCVPACV